MTDLDTQSPSTWLTLGQAASELGVHPTTLRRWADDGQITTMLTPGGHRRFTVAEVRRFATGRLGHETPERPPDSLDGVVCIGTNHRTASVAFRERLMRAAGEMRAAFAADEMDGRGLGEFVVLSTCNRIELYGTLTGGRSAGPDWLADRLARHAGITSAPVTDRLYRFRGIEVLNHLARVCAGLDSLVLGESEIAGQVARAQGDLLRRADAESVLDDLFRAARKAAKRSRAETHIGRGPASVSSVAVGLVRREVPDLRGRRVLIVGCGKMGRLAAEAFVTLGDAQLTVANRTRSRAERLAATLGAAATDLADLPRQLARADVVFTAARSAEPLLDVPAVRAALEARTTPGSLLIVDIAVPRNVVPEVGALEGVRLFGIDDLQSRVEHHLADRRQEIPRVEAIIGQEIAAFRQQRQAAAVLPLVRDLRHRAEAIRRTELEKALRDLGAVDEDVRERVEYLSRALVNKLLHEPTRRLRADARTGDGVELDRVVRTLFGLEPHQTEERPAP